MLYGNISHEKEGKLLQGLAAIVMMILSQIESVDVSLCLEGFGISGLEDHIHSGLMGKFSNAEFLIRFHYHSQGFERRCDGSIFIALERVEESGVCACRGQW